MAAEAVASAADSDTVAADSDTVAAAKNPRSGAIMRNLHFVFAIPAVLLLVVAYSHRPRRATQWGRAQPAKRAATADAALDKLRAQLARSERATEAAAAAMARRARRCV